jgi:hypothetical protein
VRPGSTFRLAAPGLAARVRPGSTFRLAAPGLAARVRPGSTFRLAALGLGALLAAACGPAPRTSEPGPPDQALTIPASEGSRAALASLGQRAAGDPEAAWVRLHYLLDLFDDARYRGDDDSLRLLIAALDEEVTEPPLRGPLQTDRVIARLQAQAGAIGDDTGAVGDARALLALDARWPRRRAEVAEALTPILALAGSRSPVAGNAALRLHGYCMAALRDAVRAEPARRPAILGHCLYPLGRAAEVEPYLAEDAPAPPLDPIVGGLERLLSIAETDPRLAPAAERQRTLLASLVSRHRSALDHDGDDLEGGAGGTEDADP